MQAKNGSASRSAARAVGWSGACCSALAVIGAGVRTRGRQRERPLRAQVAPQRVITSRWETRSPSATAQERFNIHAPTESPSFFEEGVANDSLKLLRKDTGKRPCSSSTTPARARPPTV